MKKCKKLLCLVLALVMALSLCTVAMADGETGTTPQLVTKIKIDISGYEYGNILADTDNAFRVKEAAYYVGTEEKIYTAFDSEYKYRKGADASGTEMTNGGALGVGKHTVVCTFKVHEDSNELYYLNAASEESSTVVEYTVNGVAPTTNNCTVAYSTETKTLTATIVLDALTVVGDDVDYKFTKVVELGGNTAPGAKTFTLKQVGVVSNVTINGSTNNSSEATSAVTVSGSVDTNGAGTYTTGTLTISSTDKLQLKAFLEGTGELYVQEVNDNAVGWTYDSQVWLVKSVSLQELNNILNLGITDSTGGYMVVAKKVEMDENGAYAPMEDAQWCKVEDMTFTNTYTENTTHEHTRRQPSTPATPEAPIASPKTGDMGVALYAAMALLSMSGSAVIIGKKRSK